MRPVHKATALLCLLAPSATAGPFAKDLMLRQRTVARTGAAAQEQTQYFSGSKMVTDDRHRRSIVDLTAGTLTMLDKTKKTWMVMKFADLKRESERTAKRLTELPPETRKMLGLDAAVSLSPTGRSEEIAGHPAKEYAVRGGPTTGSVWVTDDIALPVEARDWGKLTASLGGPSQPGGRLAAEMAKLEGLPVRTSLTITVGQQKTEITTEVVEVKEMAPPPELLAVPADYRQVDPPEFEN
jgi:hypothetical protein